MSKHFRPWKIGQPQLLPPRVEDFVPGDHISRFIVALVTESLDLSAITNSYTSGLGQPPFDPRIMASLRDIELRSDRLPPKQDAFIMPKGGDRLEIVFDPTRPSSRQNFSISHEISHTLFPDGYQMIRYRERDRDRRAGRGGPSPLRDDVQGVPVERCGLQPQDRLGNQRVSARPLCKSSSSSESPLPKRTAYQPRRTNLGNQKRAVLNFQCPFACTCRNLSFCSAVLAFLI